MSAHRQAVEGAFEALRIDSSTGFSWFGEPSPPLPPDAVKRMGAETARAYLCDRVQNQLYTGFYCPGRSVPPPPSRTVGRPHGSSTFIDSLSRANRGTGSREAGWTVLRQEEDGRVVVQRDGLSVWARPQDVSGGDSPGSEVSVRLPAELLRLSPGFFMALGNEEVDNDEPFVRHYWHLSPGGGAALIAAATEALNEAGLPFRLKVLIDPDSYSRCDAGVLYTPRRLRQEVAALLPSLRARVAAHLRPGTPALTKPLAAGLGVAEDPGGQSFGMHRCGLLAEAMVRGAELGLEGSEERLDLVAQHFRDHELSFDLPYLNAGSEDEYEVLG